MIIWRTPICHQTDEVPNFLLLEFNNENLRAFLPNCAAKIYATKKNNIHLSVCSSRSYDLGNHWTDGVLYSGLIYLHKGHRCHASLIYFISLTELKYDPNHTHPSWTRGAVTSNYFKVKIRIIQANQIFNFDMTAVTICI